MSDVVRPPAVAGDPPTATPPAMGGPMAGWLAPTSESRVEQIACAEVHDRPWRLGDHGAEQHESLRSSIAMRGIVEPLLLRRRNEGGFEVVCGQRRIEVARDLQQARVPAIVRNLSDREALLVAAWTTVDRRRNEHAAALLPMLHAAGLSLDELRALAAVPDPEHDVVFPRTVNFVLTPFPLASPRSAQRLPSFARQATGVVPQLPPRQLAAALRALRPTKPAAVAS